MKKLLLSLAAFLMLLSVTPAAVGAEDSGPERQVADEQDIVGGVSISISAAPWQVALFQTINPSTNPFNDQFCGGSLIHAEWVLTAAHCVEDIQNPTTDLDIGVGKTNLSEYTAADRYNVAEVIIHPDYAVHAGFSSDIALLRLATPVALSANVAVIGIDYEPTAPDTASPAFTSGWGAVQELPTQLYPDGLQGANLIIQADSTTDPVCGDWLIVEFQAGIMTCASVAAGGVSSCFGDSGGPIVSTDATPLLWGVVSFGSTCGAPTLPGVYTRAPAFRGWLAQYVPGIDCDFTGTEASETVRGTNGNDVICGLGGNDFIIGYDGDDILFGGPGNDDLRGGPGNDVLFGEGGKDGVRGNKGDDYLFGGKGLDLIAGAKGDDVAFGHGSPDEIFGGPGEDYLTGGPGDDFAKGGLDDDVVLGDEGNDRLAGNGLNDQIFGGDGNDELFGGPNADFGRGGAGTDRCVGIETEQQCET